MKRLNERIIDLDEDDITVLKEALGIVTLIAYREGHPLRTNALDMREALIGIDGGLLIDTEGVIE